MQTYKTWKKIGRSMIACGLSISFIFWNMPPLAFATLDNFDPENNLSTPTTSPDNTSTDFQSTAEETDFLTEIGILSETSESDAVGNQILSISETSFEYNYEILSQEGTASAAIVDALTVEDLKKIQGLSKETGVIVLDGKIVVFSSGEENAIHLMETMKDVMSDPSHTGFIAHTHVSIQPPSEIDYQNAGQMTEYAITYDAVYAYSHAGLEQVYSLDEGLERLTQKIHEAQEVWNAGVHDESEVRETLNRFITEMDRLQEASPEEQVIFRAAGAPVNSWGFEENGGSVASDGNGSMAFNLYGPQSPPIWTAGVVGQGALYFDGTEDYAQSASNLSPGANGVTISFWLKTTATQGIVFNWSGKQAALTSTGKLSFTVDSGSSGSATTTKVVNDGKWHLITLMSTANAQQLYVDGILDAQAVEVLATSSNYIRLGRYAGGSTNYYKGYLDDVRIYNTTLTADDAKALYQMGNLNSTVIPETVPPVVSEVLMNNVTTAGTLTWKTNEFSTATVEWGLTSSYGTTLSNSILTQSQFFTLTGLTAGNTYHYRIRSKDAQGNEFVSQDFTFSTARITETGLEYQVSQDGRGQFSSIQACADKAVAGDTCLIKAGNYNEVITTKAAGLDGKRITFKVAEADRGKVIIKQFVLNHAYITVDGFGVTGLSTLYQYAIDVTAQADYAEILNNRIYDGIGISLNDLVFTDNGPAGTDTITSAKGGFLAAGFKAGMVFSVSSNDNMPLLTGNAGQHRILSVTDNTIVLAVDSSVSITEDLTNQGPTTAFMMVNVYGMQVASTGAVVRENIFDNLQGIFANVSGDNILFENNEMKNINGWDAIRFFGHDNTFRRNFIHDGKMLPGNNNHADFIQTFADNGGESYNMLFEENWIQDMQSQLGQINSGSARGGFYDTFHDYVFRGNVFVNMSHNFNISIPNVTMEHNTFYNIAYQLSGVMIGGGSLNRGHSAGATLLNNVFLGNGAEPDTFGQKGWYNYGGAGYSSEALAYLINNLDASRQYQSFISLQYIDENGTVLDALKKIVQDVEAALTQVNLMTAQAASLNIVKENYPDYVLALAKYQTEYAKLILDSRLETYRDKIYAQLKYAVQYNKPYIKKTLYDILYTPAAVPIFDAFVSAGYMDGNGNIKDPLRALLKTGDPANLVLNAAYEIYRIPLFQQLQELIDLDYEIRSTFKADYNYVAGTEAHGFESKLTFAPWAQTVFNDLVVNGYIDSKGTVLTKLRDVIATNDPNQLVTHDTLTFFRDEIFTPLKAAVQGNALVTVAALAAVLLEAHSINGGDPLFQNLQNPLGADGIPFTADDGLIPLATSILCADGQTRGAFACQAPKVSEPVAFFKFSRVGGYEPLELQLNASQSIIPTGHTIVDYSWDLGNGTIEHGQTLNTLNHTFARGTHIITLTVTNERGEKSTMQKKLIVDPTDFPNLYLYLTMEQSGANVSDKPISSAWVGAPTYTTGPSGNGSAAYFDGVTPNYLKVPTDDLMEGWENLTVGLWAKKGVASEAKTILEKFLSYKLFFTSTGISARIYTVDSGTYTDLNVSLAGIDTTQWHHYAVTYDGQMMRLYVDGNEMGSKALTGDIVSHRDRDFVIGKEGAGSVVFKGALDDVRLYDKALSKERIVQLVQGAVVIGDSTEQITLPVAQSQTLTFNEDTAQTITLAGTDAFGKPLTYSIKDLPTSGKLVLDTSDATGRKYIYTPNANFNGTDTFTFLVSNGTETSIAATVTLKVTPVNDPPANYAIYPNYTVVQGTEFIPFWWDDATTDTEDDAATVGRNAKIQWSIVGAAPTHLSFTLDPATQVITIKTLDPNWTGSEAVTFRATDSGIGGADPSVLEPKYLDRTITFKIVSPPTILNRTLSVKSTCANGDTSCFTSIQACVNTAIAGDTCLVDAGTYNLSSAITFSNSGTKDNLITVKANGNVILNTNGFNISGRNYIRIEGFEIANTVSEGFYIAGTRGVQIVNNNIHHTAGTALRMHYANPSQDTLIQNNRISWAGNGQPMGGKGTEITGDHMIIEGNDISHVNDFNILNGSYNIIRNNLWHDAHWSDWNITTLGPHIDGIQVYRGMFNLIEGNSMYNNTGGDTHFFIAQDYQGRTDFHDFIIRNNVFYKAGEIFVLSNKMVDGIQVYNNTIVESGYGGWAVNSFVSGSTNASLVNNIFYYNTTGNEANVYWTDATTLPTIDVHNNLAFNLTCGATCYWRPSVDETPLDPNTYFTVQSNPLFANLGSDFRLQATSPAINAGGFLTKTAAAGSGTTLSVLDARMFFAGFGTVLGDEIQLEGATNTARILSVNYATNTITLDRALTWTSGQGVALKYSGARPDMGAFEYVVANPAPVATAQSVTLAEDTPTTITLAGTSADGKPLTYSIASNPLKGTLAPVPTDTTGTKFLYTPNANVNGTDSFTFKVNDGTVDSAVATVSLTINAVNDVPVLTVSGTTTLNALLAKVGVVSNFTLSGSDVEGTVTYEYLGAFFNGVAEPMPGTLNTSTGAFSWTPTSAQLGWHELKFRVKDATGLVSNEISLWVAVNPPFTRAVGQTQFSVKADGTGNFTSISACNAQTVAGDTCLVSAGTYMERVNVKNSGTSSAPVTFKASGAAIVRGFDVANLNYIVIDGFEITNNTVNLHGISMTGSTGSVIVNNYIHDLTGTNSVSGNGILLSSSNGIQILNNRILHISGIGIRLNGNVGSASSNVVIRDNVISYAGSPTVPSQGIQANGTNILVDHNDISHVADFVTAGSIGEYLVVRNNIFHDVYVSDYSTSPHIDGTQDSLSHILVEGNLMYNVHEAGANVHFALFADDKSVGLNGVVMRYNVVDGIDSAFLITQYGYDSVNVYNNTVVKTNLTSGLYSAAVAYTNTSLNGVVLNNIFYDATGPAGNNHQLYYFTQDSLTGAVVDYNLAWDSACGTTCTGWNKPSTTYYTPTGTDVNGLYNVNPLFVNYTPGDNTVSNSAGFVNDNFSLQSGSLAINAGGALTKILSSTVTGGVMTLKVANASMFQAGWAGVNADWIAVGSSSNAMQIASIDYVNNTITLTGSLLTAPLAGDSVWLYKNSEGKQVLYGDRPDIGAFEYVTTASLPNQIPVATAQTVSLNEDVVQTITLSGTDAEGKPLSYSIVSQPSKGTLVKDSNDSTGTKYIYTPNLNFNGTDSFTFKVNDGAADSAIATVSLTINPVNDAPTATFTSLTGVTEDTAKTFTLTGSDVEGSALTYTITAQPLHGTLTCTGASCTFTPALNYSGSDSFTYKVSDGPLSVNQTINFNIASVNDAPTATFTSLSGVNEDIAKSFNLTGTDPDNSTLTYSIVTAALHGTLTCTSAGACTYTSALNYNGDDSFTYKVSDGTLSVNQIVNFNVAAVNDAPTTTFTNLTGVTEDTAKTFTLTGDDVEGSALTYAITTQPLHGTLTCVGASCTYTPALNYSGSDSFGYTANDGTVDSAAQPVSFNVAAVNDMPVMNAISSTTAANLLLAKVGTASNFTLSGSDVEGSFVYEYIGAFKNGTAETLPGTLNASTGVFSWTPTSIQVGWHELKFRVKDSAGVVSNEISVWIAVNPAFVRAAGQTTLTVKADGTGNFTSISACAASAVAGDTCLISAGTYRERVMTKVSGTAATPIIFKADGIVTMQGFVINHDFIKVDGFQVTHDVIGQSGIFVKGSNAVVVNNYIYNIQGAAGIEGDWSVNPQAAYVADNKIYHSQHGIFVRGINWIVERNEVERLYKYTTGAGTDADYIRFFGEGHILRNNYLHGSILSELGTAHADCFQTFDNGGYTTKNILIDSNMCMDFMQGVFGEATYVHANSNFTISNNVFANSLSPTQSFTINVYDTPGVQVLNNTFFRVSAGGINISSNAYSQPLSAVVKNNIIYELGSNYSTYSFKVGSNPTDPSSYGDYNLIKTTLGFTPIPGTHDLIGVDPQFVNMNNILGDDGKIFTADDGLRLATNAQGCASGENGSSVGAYACTVINQVPVATAQTVVLDEDVAQTVTLSGTDAEGKTLSYSIASQPSKGTLVKDPNDSTGTKYIYTPNKNYYGADTFTFKVNDGTVDSAEAVVTLNIANVNDMPTATTRLSFVTPGETYTGKLTAMDVDNMNLTYSIVGTPPAGLTINADGTFSYAASASFTTISFTYQVTDGLLSKTGTVTLKSPTLGKVITAASASYADVLAAVNAAQDGDTVVIPSGTATWASTLNITKAITLQGAGSDDTKSAFTKIIYGGANPLISINLPSDKPVRVSGIYFDLLDNSTAARHAIRIVGDKTGSYGVTQVRIDNNTFNKGTRQVYWSGWAYGLVDHNAFINGNIAVMVQGDNDYAWQREIRPGTSDAVFIEDNTFTVNNQVEREPNHWIYHQEGGRSVTRRNIFDGSQYTNGNSLFYDSHGNLNLFTSTNADMRGQPMIEVYDNIFHAYKTYNFMNIRGGASLIYNNQMILVTGSTNTLLIEEEESWTSGGPFLNDPGFKPDQIWPGEDQINNSFFWGNTLNGAAITTVKLNKTEDAAFLQEGRDFWMHAPDATSGRTVYTDRPGGNMIFVAGPNAYYGYKPYGDHPLIPKVNNPPLATLVTLADVAEDIAKAFTLTGSDVEGSVLTYTVITQPLHGTLTCSLAGVCTYTSALNYNGADSFTYKVNDGTSDSAVATVSLTVNAVNDAPTATLTSLSGVNEDIAKSFNLTGTDPDNSTLTYSIVTAALHGTLTCSLAGVCSYVSALNYSGPDSFTYKVSDGTLSVNQIVNFNVAAVNDMPIATAQSLSLNEDALSQKIVLGGSDADGNALTYAIVNGPSRGTLAKDLTDVSGRTYLYTPEANYNGTDFFTFKANDGSADSAVATVSLTITPVNDVPIATFVSLTGVNEDVTKNFTLTGTDLDGNPLTYSIVTTALHGTLSCTAAGACTYLSALNYSGPDSFTYKVSDINASVNQIVSFNVAAVNDVPTVAAMLFTGDEDSILSGNVTGNDTEGSVLTYRVVGTAPAGLKFNLDGTFNYQPVENFNGTITFDYIANDGIMDSVAARVTMNINPINDVPIAAIQSLSLNEDALSQKIVLNGSDVDGNALTYAIVNGPSHGALAKDVTDASGKTYLYTPSENYNGTDTFTFKVNDGKADSAVATVSLTINPVNDIPVAETKELQVLLLEEDSVRTFALKGTDVDGDALSYSIVTLPTHGKVTCSGANCTYIPDANYSGADTLSFRVFDGKNYSASAEIPIAVSPVNDAPVLNAISDQTGMVGQSLSIALKAFDVDGDGLLYQAMDVLPQGAVLDEKTGKLIWMPAAAGEFSIRFQVFDGKVYSNELAINFTINPPIAADEPPIVSDVTTSEPDVDPNTPGDQVYTGTDVTYTATATDVNSKNLTWKWYYTVGGKTFLYSQGTGTTATATYSYTKKTAKKKFTWTVVFSDGTSSVSSSAYTTEVVAKPTTRTPLRSMIQKFYGI